MGKFYPQEKNVRKYVNGVLLCRTKRQRQSARDNLPHLIPIASLNSEGVEHRWESSIFRGLLHNKLRFETYPPVGTWGGESNLALTCAEPAGHGTKLSCNLYSLRT